MRINTDGVLLGSWAEIPSSHGAHILEIGTGSGVIAAQLAQRISDCGRAAAIDALEPHSGSFLDAEANFADISNLFPNVKITAYNCTLQNFSTHLKYDLIISNPPYFTNSLKSSTEEKCIAKHADSLPQGEIICAAENLLAPHGRLALILPSNEAEEFLRKVSLIKELTATRICRVHTTPSKPAKRYMMEFARCGEGAVAQEELSIMEGGEYTAEYSRLTGEFYLNF